MTCCSRDSNHCHAECSTCLPNKLQHSRVDFFLDQMAGFVALSRYVQCFRKRINLGSAGQVVK